jgi:hypothetical protein
VKFPEQLTLDDEVVDDLSWHAWFVSLPTTPSTTSTATPSSSLPASTTHPKFTPRVRTRAA